MLLTALGATLTASASITTSNLADWKTAVGTYTEITFTEHPLGSNLANAYDALGVSFSAVSIQENTSGFPNPPTSDTRYGNVDAYTDWSVSFDGTVTDITLESPFGFGSMTGLAFWATDFRRNGVTVGSITLGGLSEGYRSTVPFDEIRFTYFGNNAGMAFDNFYFGPINPVPEPASCAALGLGCIALVRRRKRA